jgi:hypothetical protein
LNEIQEDGHKLKKKNDCRSQELNLKKKKKTTEFFNKKKKTVLVD